MPGIEFGFSVQAIGVILALAAAGAAAFFYYRSTLPPLPRLRRLLLLLLRLVSLCILVALVFQPLLRLTYPSTQPPGLAVLVDNSRSMRLVDRFGSRASAVRSLLNGETLHRARRDATLRYYTFGARAAEDSRLPGDTLTFAEEATDISAPLRELEPVRERLNLRAVLLMTDGSYTLGENPLTEAERLGLPLYTVGIGDSSEQRDVAISRLLANDVVLSTVRTPVDATIRSSGFNGERTSIGLFEGEKELDRATLVLGSGTREYPVRLWYTPEGSGVKRYTLRISPLQGEITAANNQRSFSARVLRNALHILILAGAPGPDLTMIRQTIAEQPNFTVHAFTERKGGGFYEGRIPQGLLDSADCLILIGLPTQSTTAATMDMVRQLLDGRTVPLLFLPERDIDARRMALLGSMIPFTLSTSTAAEEMIGLRAEPVARGNPLVDPGEGTASWTRLPPIYRLRGTYRSRPEATVLLTSTLLGVPTGEPLLLTRSIGQQKSVALTGYGIWRWRLMTQGDNSAKDILPSFLTAAVRWLTTPEDLRRFKVSATQERYPQGEPVTFEAQLTSSTAQPLDDARVRVVVRRAAGVAEADLRSLGNGRYEGSMEGLEEGDYAFHATAERNGTTVEQDSGRFAIGAMDLEFRETRMNSELLRQLAERTGGRYFTPDDFGSFDSVLHAQRSFVPRTTRTVADLELWHWRTLLAVLILLFAAEWLLRKWHGML